MLITRVLGDCPGCGGKNCFGNVSVRGDHVLRGCMNCKYKTNVWLPKARKKILYLDQFFFSSAFRKGDPRFVEAAQRIRRLCELQLLVVPFSSIHEDETNQWGGFDGKNKQDLMEFIKATSRGHEFEPAYDVELTQIMRAFQAFLADHSPEFAFKERDIVRGEIHEWDDYFRIDVSRYIGNVELIRNLKQESIEELLDAFDGWRQSTNTFVQDVALEMRAAGKVYLDSYFQYLMRFAGGDYDVFDRPIKSTVIEQMLFYFAEETQPEECLKQVVSFFLSKHFAEIPYQWLGTRMFATLKDMVKRGAYANREKAQQRLNGIFYDVEHIATYAPYCDAFIMDQPMAALVSDSRVGLEKRYGVKVYSLNAWDGLFAWLDSVEKEMTDEHKAGLSAAYPKKSGY
jgi:hypothetical protein